MTSLYIVTNMTPNLRLFFITFHFEKKKRSSRASDKFCNRLGENMNNPLKLL